MGPSPAHSQARCSEWTQQAPRRAFVRWLRETRNMHSSRSLTFLPVMHTTFQKGCSLLLLQILRGTAVTLTLSLDPRGRPPLSPAFPPSQEGNTSPSRQEWRWGCILVPTFPLGEGTPTPPTPSTHFLFRRPYFTVTCPPVLPGEDTQAFLLPFLPCPGPCAGQGNQKSGAGPNRLLCALVPPPTPPCINSSLIHPIPQSLALDSQ